jgi:hypothetical protein
MNRIIILLLALFTLGSCTNYGKKVKKDNIEVYYKEGITSDEAEKTAALIESEDKKAGNKSSRKSFQLLRSGDTVTLRMVVDVERAKGMGDETFNAIASLVSETSFNSKPVKMELTDAKFKTIRNIAYKKPEVLIDETNTAAFGEKVEEGNAEVYIKGASTQESTLLAGYLNDYFKPETTYSFQLIKDDIGNYTVKMVGNPDRVNSLDKSFFAKICQGICDKVLSVPAVTFEMTDAKFNVLRTFNYPADTGNSDINN